MHNAFALPVTVAGRDLAEFGAKMQSWPEISACEVDTGIFQGVGRNTMHLLQQRRGVRRFTCRIDFWGQSPREWAENISAFSALLSDGPVEIDIGDGYLYQSILLAESAPIVSGEVVATMEYQFQAVRHWEARTFKFFTSTDGDTIIDCQSNIRKTDCTIKLSADSGLAQASGLRLILNGISWSYLGVIGGTTILDGIHKTYTMAMKPISTELIWTDFPYLIPGENTISIWNETASGEGGRIYTDVEITYVPTFL